MSIHQNGDLLIELERRSRDGQSLERNRDFMAKRVQPVASNSPTPGGTARMLSQVLESTSDCILTLDRDWRFTFMNKRARAELQSGTTLLGVNVLDAFPQLADTPFWLCYQKE